MAFPHPQTRKLDSLSSSSALNEHLPHPVHQPPQLLVIGFYERYLAAGKKLRESRKNTTQFFFNSLHRYIKNMPLVEAIVGSSSNVLYDAIFGMEVAEDFDTFDESNDDVPALRSFHPRENVRREPSPSPNRSRQRLKSLQRITTSDCGSSRTRLLSALTLVNVVSSTEISSISRSPLARFFAPRSTEDPLVVAATKAAVKKIRTLSVNVRELPV